MKSIRTAIVGAAGYTGVELLRLLANHPDVELSVVTSRQHLGTSVETLFPNLRGWTDLCFSAPDTPELRHCDLVFFATPNGTAMRAVPELMANGTRVVDLAADFRLQDPHLWEQWYGMAHACPELLQTAVYGLPEVNRTKISQARLVANPGCYPTAVCLGLLPLLESNLIDPLHLVADAKSGVSGAGRKEQVSTLFCEVGDSFKAYNAPGHRHQPEIEQILAVAAGESVGLTFVPHLVPMLRGIHATLYARLKVPACDLQRVYEDRYRDEPFVDVLPPGSHPETRSVRGSNLCRIAVHRPRSQGTAVVLCVIDNLVKGAAGQAVQNMNLMFGLDEARALNNIALLP